MLRDAIHAKKSFSARSKSAQSAEIGGDTKPTPSPLPTNKETIATPSSNKTREERRKTPATSASSDSSRSEQRRDGVFSPQLLPHPYSSLYTMSHMNPSGEPMDGFSHSSMASMGHQLRVTPSTGNAAPSTARKRPRLNQDSPFPSFAYQRHYHHRPYSYYPYGPSNTPPLSMMFSPPNFRTQSYAFSPASIPGQHYAGESASAASTAPNQGTTRERGVDHFIPSSRRTSGNDCWIGDVPPFAPDNPSRYANPQMARQQLIEEAIPEHPQEPPSPNFDLFNEEILSDSEQRDGSISPFTYPKRDSL